MFGKNTETKIAEKQAKQKVKDKAAIEKFGLDFDNYTPEDIKQRNIAPLKEIATSLAGSKLYSFGSLLSGNSNETFALELARAQIEQNFILMRQWENEELLMIGRREADGSSEDPYLYKLEIALEKKGKIAVKSGYQYQNTGANKA